MAWFSGATAKTVGTSHTGRRSFYLKGEAVGLPPCAHRHKNLLASLLQRKAIPATLQSFLTSRPYESGRRKYSDPNLVSMFNILEVRVKATLGLMFKTIPSLLGLPLSIDLLAETDHGQHCRVLLCALCQSHPMGLALWLQNQTCR